MNKSAIQKYAIWARNELIDKVKLKAFEYGVSKDETMDANADSVNGKILTSKEKAQRQELIKKINELGFDETIEEVAYTWFNRFIALRFMEVNNYLPTRIRVFTNENDEFKPEILKEALNLEFEGLDKQYIFNCIQENKDEELYKYLLIAQCNDMGQYLPGMFTKISDYKVLLFPDNLLRPDSVIGRLISDIDEDTWLDQVQSIGWLYQYYISERHNQVVNILKGTVSKKDIPAATQLWTTDWVVRYMVDNSLGRYWIERNPDSALKDKLQYLATSKDGSLPVVNEKVDPTEIKFFDPCMGSGHILVYAFDILMEIYRECGYSDRDAAANILQYNLFGLDIDDRAYQLAYFAVMMKARSYNRRILIQGVWNNLTSIDESNDIQSFEYEGLTDDPEMNETGNYLVSVFKDAKETGSLLTIKKLDYKRFGEYLINIQEKGTDDLFSLDWVEHVLPKMLRITKQASILSNQYTVVTTNPPYMGKLEGHLKKFVASNYKDFSTDVFAVFMRRNFDFTIQGGYMGFMTPFVWMFIKSYEKLRNYIIKNKSIATLVQMEYSAYDEATVPICSFVLKNEHNELPGYYYRLSDFKGGMEVQKQKVLEANQSKDCGYFYETLATNFSKIPGSPIAYWANSKLFDIFSSASKIRDNYFSAGRNKTHNNNKYVRSWWEITNSDRWQPYANGGAFRRWGGNQIDVVDWTEEAKQQYAIHGGLYNQKFVGKQGVCWNLITSYKNGFRIKKEYEHFSSASPTIISDDQSKDFYTLSFLNCIVSEYILKMYNPTLNTTVGDVLTMPLIITEKKRIEDKSKYLCELSESDWNSFEISWNFSVHPLLKNHVSTVSEAYSLWKQECEDRFMQLKVNEEELNRIFIDIYGLQDELNPEVEDIDITVYRVYDSKDDVPESMKKSNYVLTKKDVVVSLISYAVGCMFGRYSLDVERLAYAGGEFDWSKYKSFIPDKDNIIPICDDEYFEDDIVGRFVKFIEVVYGKSTLDENLSFIASALGGNGNPRDVIRDYFLKDFYKDHCKTYKKRPIYWLFDSGKKNGFKALMYIHRYKPDLIARLRTDYVHETQSRLNHSINMINSQLESDISSSERQPLRKTLDKFKSQAEEVKKYEEIVHHYADQMIPMNLDDGVKVNYAKFKDLLAKIK